MKKNNYKNLEVRSEEEIEEAHYARATTDTAFKIMMSDLGIAQALVNSLFEDISDYAKVKIDPVEITSAGEVNVPLQGKKANATMDFHGITKNRDHVIIEMQILHHDNFDRRALFYAASTFANQQYEGGTEWHSQIKNVYAIQFVDYFTKDKEQGQFRKYYRMTDWLSEEKQVIEGISLIQVELAGMQILGNKLKTGKILTPAEWWYYVIENSENLTEAQIARYKSLGMPSKLKDALEKLKFRGWEAKYKKIYGKEIKEVDTYRLELDRQRQEGREEGEIKGRQEGEQKGREEGRQEGKEEGRQEGEMRGHIKGLIERFIYDENMERSLKAIRNQEIKFSKELAEKVWDEYASQGEGIPDNKTRDEFIVILERENVLEPGEEEGPVEESKEGK